MQLRTPVGRFEARCNRSTGPWALFAQRYYSGQMVKVWIGPVVLTFARWGKPA